jgi:hypothetical protein
VSAREWLTAVREGVVFLFGLGAFVVAAWLVAP